MKRTGLIGWPVAHSLSPRIHGYWIAQHKLDATYELWPIEPGQLESRLAELRSAQVHGFNVTVPHKETVMAFLDDVESGARKIGAVNTVGRMGQRLGGYNTDAYGFLNHLEEEVRRQRNAALDPFLQHVLILGSGGAARAAVSALKQRGAARITLVNRTAETAQALASEMGVQHAPWDKRSELLRDVSLLVNSTSLGMKGKPPLEIALDALPKGALVYDIVYNPLETELLRAATARGNAAIDGLGMLLYQAQAAFELWHGVEPKVDEALRAHVLAGLA